MFDYRCMVTGVNLGSSPTALVLLRGQDDDLAPAALPMWRMYDECGTVDGIELDYTAKTIAPVWNDLAERGVITVAGSTFHSWPGTIRDAEHLAEALRDALPPYGVRVSCAGTPLTYGLISSHVARALFRAPLDGVADDPGLESLLESAFGDAEPARSLYEPVLRAAARTRYVTGCHLLGLIGTTKWLRSRDRPINRAAVASEAQARGGRGDRGDGKARDTADRQMTRVSGRRHSAALSFDHV